jgi:ABC-type transporter Mla subunit MlaD
MDQQEQQGLNEAAQQFTEAFVQAQRAAADRGVSMQEQNAQLTQDFFNRVIENLRTQAEDTRQMGQQLADQQQRATEAGRTLTQESVSAYMDFVNSMFSTAQLGGQAAQRGAQEAPPRGGG